MKTTKTTSLFAALLALLLFATVLLAAGTASTNVARASETTNNAVHGMIEPFVNLQYKVMLWEGIWTVTIRGKIDEYATLPATVEVGVPAGSDVFWFGEVYAEWGVPPMGNPEFLPPYTMRTEGDTDIYTAVLTTAHAVQIEYTLPYDPRIETPEGPGVRVTYTPLHDVEDLWLAAALPPGTAVLDRDIRYLGTGPHGELAFAYVIEDAVGGQEYSADIIYVVGATETVSSISPAIPIGIAVSVILLAGGGFWYYKRNEFNEDT